MTAREQQGGGGKSREGQKQEPARQSEEGRKEPWWQWLIAGAGALLVLATVGYLAYRGVSAPATPPAIGLSVQQVDANADSYVVVVEVVNRGGRTAAGIKITGSLRRAGALLEQDEFTFDYLPPNSPQRGGLIFGHDPYAPGVQLNLDVSGYTEP